MKMQKRIRPLIRVGEVFPPDIYRSSHVGLMQTHSLESDGRFYFQQKWYESHDNRRQERNQINAIKSVHTKFIGK